VEDHAVLHLDAVDTPRACHWPMMNRKDNAVALAQRHYFDPRLHARPLLGQHELSSREIAAGLTEQERDLQREDVCSIEILV
jgi:hypothetical protein